jgi:hypothetical protein
MPISSPRPPLPFPSPPVTWDAARPSTFLAGVCRYPWRPSSIPTWPGDPATTFWYPSPPLTSALLPNASFPLGIPRTDGIEEDWRCLHLRQYLSSSAGRNRRRRLSKRDRRPPPHVVRNSLVDLDHQSFAVVHAQSRSSPPATPLWNPRWASPLSDLPCPSDQDPTP